MRSWYEFGYDGFPSGEQRRRFYRQRDDPCDSEEERDHDDETNDRPVFYYPLRASEEGSRSSNPATSSSPSATDESGEEESSACGGAQCVRVGAALSSRRSRGAHSASHGEPPLRCLVHSTLYEDTPAWYGSSTVTLASISSAGEVFTLQYGGVACASPAAVSNQLSVWRWSSPLAATTASTPLNEAVGGVRCERVVDDASLLSRLRWGAVHPALRLGHTAGLRAPPRIGHCAVPLASLDPSVLLYFLSDRGRVTPAAAAASQPGAGVRRREKPAVDDRPALLAGDDVRLDVSFVLGGASHLVDLSNSGAGSWPVGDGSPFRGSSMDRIAIPPPHVLSHPALCLTLIARAAPQPRQHTLHFPLDGLAMSSLLPRAFATLTPWPDADVEASACRSFAYIGGTENGRDPISYLEVELFHVHLDTWMWRSNPIATYGAKPSPRFGHAVAMAEEDACLLMFGGIGAGHAYLSDLHVLDLRTRVWREVFVPFGVAMPRRAFFTAAVLTFPEIVRGGGVDADDSKTFSDAGLCRFAAQAAVAVTRQASAAAQPPPSGASTPLSRAQGSVHGHDQDEADSDAWPASVTGTRSRGVLMLLGGECEGRPVASVLACTLRSGRWRRVSFPLRSQPHFTHVARSALPTEPGVHHGGRLLSRTDFRTAVHAMTERALRTGASLTPHSVARSHRVDDPYIAVCHGSLAQAVQLRAGDGGGERLLLVGGTQGPSVSVVSEVTIMGTSLSDSASLWVLSAHQHAPLTSTLHRRLPHLHAFCFCRNPSLSRAAQSMLRWESSRSTLPGATSAEAARTESHLSESVLEGQLMEWTQSARKRLRDCV
ncbi:Kelch motif/Galactose oxidase, central domain containing protein [Novymonas esmeraldas]|uniref:Kelch motif/Galactose oxidase, central domain containing protein n=1 Tax=Novymonas esmeraldas TaxID=1808958 RepID=A0AAW0EYT9_9TRYP